MIGISPVGGSSRIWWKCFTIRQSRSCLERFYSNEKLNNNSEEKKPAKKTLVQRMEEGVKLGKWKFYVQDLVFKNLQPDSVPSSYKMCYRSGLETYANFAILVAVSTSIALPVFLSCNFFMGGGVGTTTELAAIAIATLASSMSLGYISLQVPMRIYYSAQCDDFLVYFPRLIPYTSRKINIQPGHVTPPTSSSNYLPWINIQHVHTQTKKKMLIDGDKFILPMYYNKLMGY